MMRKNFKFKLPVTRKGDILCYMIIMVSKSIAESGIPHWQKLQILGIYQEYTGHMTI